MTDNRDDPTLRRTYMAVALVGLVAAIVAFVGVSGHWGSSVAVGAGIATVNLYVLARTVQNLLGGGRRAWVVLALLKFAALFGITYLMIRSGVVAPLGLAVGFGSLPFGILLATALAPKQPIDDDFVSGNTDHA